VFNRTTLITLLLTLGFDQLTKDGARLFGFTTVINAGISFNLFTELSADVTSLLLLAITVFLWYGLPQLWHQNVVATGLFFGGGLSNILDRVLYGGVRDWIPVPLTTIRNNVADWAIGVAVVLFFIHTISIQAAIRAQSKKHATK
jgi:lipoprotein signal peptidase